MSAFLDLRERGEVSHSSLVEELSRYKEFHIDGFTMTPSQYLSLTGETIEVLSWMGLTVVEGTVHSLGRVVHVMER